MKKLFVLIIIALFSEILQAQVTVSGLVTDVGGNPLSAVV